MERFTLIWNVFGIFVLGCAAYASRSVALVGFGLDSLIEIGASTVVLWELAATNEDRQKRALSLIGISFIVLSIYIAAQSVAVLVTGFHPGQSTLGIIWTAITALVMFSLAAGKARTGKALNNKVLQTEGRVTLIDGLLATAVLLGLVMNALFGAWWADPLAGFVIVYYGIKEARAIFSHEHSVVA